MNFKLMPVAVCMALSAVVAQETSETVATPAEMTSAPAEATAIAEAPADSATMAPAPAAEAPLSVADSTATTEEAPAAIESSELALDAVTDTAKANFDVLRGRAYNTVGNQAAASTIADHVAKPHEMFGSKLVYLEPTLEYATLAFGENKTYFLNFKNSNGLGTLTAGLATSSFGAEVYASIGKAWVLRDDSNRDYSESRVSAGDEFGAVFSMPLGNIDLAVTASWLTLNSEISTENDIHDTHTHSELERDYWDLSLKGVVSNTPAKEKAFSWAAGLTVRRHNLTETEIEDNKETDYATLDSRFELDPFFNIGYQVLKTNNARVFLGLNSELPVAIYDNIQNDVNYVRKNHLGLGIFTTPNILAELAVTENWFVFGGASYTWNVFSTEYLYEAATDITAFSTVANRVNVNAGARFQYKNYAIEVAIADSFFNNPLAGFNGNNFLATFGGFINF